MTSIHVIGRSLISTNIPGSVLQVHVYKIDCQSRLNGYFSTEFNSPVTVSAKQVI